MNILKRGRRGFTLIELLVVIAIIGILASIVLVSLNDARQSARDTKKIGDMRQAQLGLELFFTENDGAYPDPANVLNCDAANWDTAFGVAGADIPQLVTANAGGDYSLGADAASSPTNYTILSTMEGTPSVLGTDIDGTSNVCACDDPAYCISP
jgi:prepilin-type N-terminal cleavage/methylation domain-containing protein